MYSYRVLTPTMYRSRMATARQAVSMDYDDDSGAVKKARLRREGPAMRGPSPLLRPGKLLRAQRSSGENSFDLELGASATRVHQLPQANAKYKRLSPNVHQQLSAGKCPLLYFGCLFSSYWKSPCRPNQQASLGLKVVGQFSKSKERKKREKFLLSLSPSLFLLSSFSVFCVV